MTYGKYAILADVDTVEQWDIDAEGVPVEHIHDYGFHWYTEYEVFNQEREPLFRSSSLDEVKGWCDEH